MRRCTTVVAVALATIVVTLATTAVASSAHPYCGQRWGSTPEQVTTGSAGELSGVRAGRHACFDRLVLDVDGDLDGYFVRYVDELSADGSGEPVAVRGGARLQVIATAPVVHSDSMFTPDGQLVDVRSYRTFRQVVWAGSFEGQSTVGLGVRARLPFRAFILDGPGDRSRLVVDVAHRW